MKQQKNHCQFYECLKMTMIIYHIFSKNSNLTIFDIESGNRKQNSNLMIFDIESGNRKQNSNLTIFDIESGNRKQIQIL